MAPLKFAEKDHHKLYGETSMTLRIRAVDVESIPCRDTMSVCQQQPASFCEPIQGSYIFKQCVT